MGGEIKISSLIKSPQFDEIKKYLISGAKLEKRIFIIVPYIKTNVLKKLLEGIKSEIIIITSWKPEDLVTGSSELEIYPLCKQEGITLYINNRIHLKVFSAGLDDMILTSANISQRGLGLIPKYNFECGTYIEKLNNSDRLYIAQIQKEAIYVDEKLYSELKNWLDSQKKIKPIKNEIEGIIPLIQKESFLISSLPMTKSVEILEKTYEKLRLGTSITDKETRDCVFHDLANFSIPLGMSQEKFKEKLKKEFFEHPFIKKIDEFISPEAYFGEIKEWIQNNCTDVPVPSRRELTGNVQVLYDWFEKLGDGKYIKDRPNYSERLTKVKP